MGINPKFYSQGIGWNKSPSEIWWECDDCPYKTHDDDECSRHMHRTGHHLFLKIARNGSEYEERVI